MTAVRVGAAVDRREDERGGVFVLAAFVLLLGLLLVLATGPLIGAVAARARADSAADAAALAGADQLALGRPDRVCPVARQVATANEAVLDDCTRIGDDTVEVVVRVGGEGALVPDARSRSRARVHWDEL